MYIYHLVLIIFIYIVKVLARIQKVLSNFDNVFFLFYLFIYLFIYLSIYFVSLMTGMIQIPPLASHHLNGVSLAGR